MKHEQSPHPGDLSPQLSEQPPPDPGEPLRGPEAASGPDKPHKKKGGKKRKKPSALKALLRLLCKLLLVAGVFWLALLYVFGVFRLSGNNMYPMLKDGDLCITYKLEEYHSQDVVAYRLPDGTLTFGRIIARAGDTVSGDESGILLNGGHPNEEVFYPTRILDTALDRPLTLAEGQYVLLNDMREDLSDSRSYGVIDESALEGKVIFIFRRRGF